MVEAATFISDSQRSRSRLFDDYVESAHEALQPEAIRVCLGDMSARLLSINDSAYLPNFRNGRPVIPTSKKDSIDAAVVPYLSAEADQFGLVPYEWSVPTQILRAARHFLGEAAVALSDQEAIDLLLAEIRKDTEEESENVSAADYYVVHKPLAETFGWNVYTDETTSETITSPQLVMLSPKLHGAHSYFRGGTLLHEYAHIDDILTSPTNFAEDLDAESIQLKGELRSNTVNAAVDIHYFDQYDPATARAAKVGIALELARKLFNKEAGKEFDATSELARIYQRLFA